jgi:hypothetical protein
MTDDRTTRQRGIARVVGALVVAGMTLAASPALATCFRDCRTLIRTDFRACKAACGTGIAARPCKQACAFRRRARMSACRIALAPTPPECGQTTPTGSFTCTEVLGFSQTGMWFLDVADGGGGTFEPLVGDAEWELRAGPGAGVAWQDPSFSGWTSTPYSPCAQNADNPDRVLLTISVPSGIPTLNWWVTNIQAEIATIRQKYSNVREIILQSVVGGPSNSVCYFNGNRADPVHASVIHPTIDQAIARIVGGDVVAGFSPTVRSCGDYADNTGHLVPGARPAIGTTIGQFYATFQP